MSICRFFWDGSDVYLFHHVGGYWNCCGCILYDEWIGDLDDEDAVVAHLEEHVEAGHTVPEYAFEHFGAAHPRPESFQEARDEWRGENYDKYGWMWDREHPRNVEARELEPADPHQGGDRE